MLSLGLLHLTCGGAPASPSPTPVAPPNNMSIEATPATGSTVVTTACTQGNCASVTVSVTMTLNVALAEASQVYVQLLDSAGRQCASGFSSFSPAMPAPISTIARITTFTLQCPLPITTTNIRATLLGPPGNLPADQRPGVYTQSFVGGWTFVR